MGFPRRLAFWCVHSRGVGVVGSDFILGWQGEKFIFHGVEGVGVRARYNSMKYVWKRAKFKLPASWFI